MRLNTLKPQAGSRPNQKRVGRGISSGKGKTCGRGHKGQKARSGGKVPAGFEGGQTPIHRRLPKYGFTNDNRIEEVRLSEIQKLTAADITLAVLQDAGIVSGRAKGAKIFLSGELSRKVKIIGVGVTKGAKTAIEAAGGSIEEISA
ncbi:MAG: 50S ribosomal protein L15 [Legionellales bacterium]|nr:MAG: 50S ribosomal protein L15 [Legionellales bacterium]